MKPLDLTGYSRKKVWCGPAALALLTETPVVTTTELLTRICGGTYDELEGTYEEELQLAAHELGYETRKIALDLRYKRLKLGPTLHRYLDERGSYEKVWPHLIGIGKHWIASQMGFLADSATKAWVLESEFPGQNRKVNTVIELREKWKKPMVK